MDVRKGVLRCSSRKLRSSSFVELVAVDKDKHTEKKEQLRQILWCILSLSVTTSVKSKTESHTRVKFCGTFGVTEKTSGKEANQCTLTFVVCLRQWEQKPVYCDRKNSSIPKSRQKCSFFSDLSWQLYTIQQWGVCPHKLPHRAIEKGEITFTFLKNTEGITNWSKL